MTSHPKDLSDELIKTIATSKKVSHDIHLPVQSGSTKILEAMNRRYTREHYLSIVSKIKAAIPDANISTDIIVGFPGETEEDFEQTLSLMRIVKYSQIFAFMYSKRRGTVAEKMDGQISVKVKHERVNKVLNLQKELIKGAQ